MTNLFTMLMAEPSYFPTLASGIVTTTNYWAQRVEKDVGQDSSNPHIIAARIIARGGPITHLDINAVLASQGHSITAEELEELKSIPFNTFFFSVPELTIKTLKDLYPKMPKGEGQWGIYMWFNMAANKYYVGSTQVMWERLAHYWKNHTGANLRKILADIQNIGLENFLIDIIDLPLHLQELRLLLAAEQYYLLSMNPVNNTLYVAGGSPGGMRVADINREKNSQKLYMYYKGYLLYIFSSIKVGTNSFVTVLSSSDVTLNKCIKDNVLFLGAFTMSREPLDVVKAGATLSTSLLQRLVADARVIHGQTRQTPVNTRTTPPITLVQVTDGKSFTFGNYLQAAKWHKEQTGKSLHYATIDRRLKDHKPINGYFVRLVSD
jgi:hypothetical protein